METAAEEPRVMYPVEDMCQYAIKVDQDFEPMTQIYNALREGKVKVFRVMNQQENQWDAEEQEGRQHGRRGQYVPSKACWGRRRYTQADSEPEEEKQELGDV